MSLGSFWLENNNNLRSGDTEDDNSYDKHYRPSPLPNFCDNIGRLDPEHWADILMRIERENRDAIEKEYVNFRLFIVPETVQLIFTICVRLELPHEIRYLALFIYEEFMRVQITRLYEEVMKSNDDEKRYDAWSTSSFRFISQSTLRAVTSISIAIKCCYYRLASLSETEFRRSLQTLNANLLQRLLVAINHLYDEQSILKSEHRVFSTIMFSVSINRNPILIMETIVCCMLYKHAPLLDFVEPEPLWEHAVLFMDLIYLNLKEVYKKLWEEIHQENRLNETFILERERTWHLEADFVSLALAVIAVSAYSLYGEQRMVEVIAALNSVTKVNSEEISLFARVILTFVTEVSEVEPPSIAFPNDLLGMKHINSSPDLNFF